jgi:hypothetical protein
MRITNSTGENTDNILNGSMTFEAELYHSEINPKISFFKDNITGQINLSLSKGSFMVYVFYHYPFPCAKLLVDCVPKYFHC